MPVLAALFVATLTQTPTPKELPMTTPAPIRVSGSFDVKVAPREPDHASGEAGVARMVLDKAYHGELEAAAVGQMLASGDGRTNGGYVAMERVSGTLRGRKGAFALMHGGTMDRGRMDLWIQVVPGSGSGELAGIQGTMSIRIEAGGKHFYDFEYTLPQD